MIRYPVLALAAGLALSACGEAPEVRPAATAAEAGPTARVRDTVLPAAAPASGIAEPVLHATLSTKLMGTVTAVLVHEGDAVRAGQVLARIDARDITARRAQADAGIEAAEAASREARQHAERMRALHADEAATRAQLDAAEAGLARAEAGLAQARAMAGEAAAAGDYGVIRAPFAGIVNRRWVDPGAFAAPGAPLVEVLDPSRLRLSVTVPAAMAAAIRRGQRVPATVEGLEALATIEGVVPAPAGAVYTVNALVENRDRRLPAGGAATLALGAGTRRAVLVPQAALVRQGELVGVRLRGAAGTDLRWITIGRPVGEEVEVLTGLAGGETVELAAGAR